MIDDTQRAEVSAAAAKARAGGFIAEAEQLEGFLKDNPAPAQASKPSLGNSFDAVKARGSAPAGSTATPNVSAPDDSYFTSGVVGAGTGVLGGGKVLESMANKYAPYNPNATTAPMGNKTFAAPQDLAAKVEANLNRPSVSVQGVSDAELARKIPGASGSSNYARMMPGELMPDRMADLAEDMTKTSERGAQRLAAVNEQNVAKQKALVGDTFALRGRGAEQLALPKSEIDRQLAEAEKLTAEKQAAKSKLAKEAGEHAAKTRAGRLLEVEKLKAKPGAKAAEQLAKLKELTATPTKYLTKAGEALNAATGTLPTNMIGRGLAGFGAGIGADEAVTRWNKGQKIRGVVSGLGAAGDLAAMSRHPVAMGVGTAAGLAAPLVINPALDKLAEAYPEFSEKIGLAQGGSVDIPHMAFGGRMNIGRPNVAFGAQSQQRQGGFSPYMGYQPFNRPAVNPAAAVGRFPMPNGYRSPVQAASTPVQQNLGAQTQTSSSLLPQVTQQPAEQMMQQPAQQMAQQPMQKSFIGYGDDLSLLASQDPVQQQSGMNMQSATQKEASLGAVGGQTSNGIVAPAQKSGGLPFNYEEGFVNPYPNAPAFTGDISSFLKAGGKVKKHTIHTLPKGLSKEQFEHLCKGGHVDY